MSFFFFELLIPLFYSNLEWINHLFIGNEIHPPTDRGHLYQFYQSYAWFSKNFFQISGLKYSWVHLDSLLSLCEIFVLFMPFKFYKHQINCKPSKKLKTTIFKTVFCFALFQVDFIMQNNTKFWYNVVWK